MKLFCRQFGTGTPVIILHGLLGMSDNWVTFARRLAETNLVILPDLRNHGQSPQSETFDFPALVSDILELIEDSGFGKVSLIGHSLGGKTAALLALESPELVSRLVVVDISLRKYTGHHEHLDLINAMLDADISTASSRSELEKRLSHNVPSLRIRQFLMKSAYWKDRDHLDWRFNLEVIRKNLPNIFEGITPDKKYNGPSLFIRGSLSDYVTQEDLPLIFEHFPGAMTETISGASHWVHADAPEEFFQKVFAFLNK